LRENVVKSKIALVKTRVALEKRILASQSGLGGVREAGHTQLVGVGAGGGRGGLLDTGDHLKFGLMLGKVCEVDEEVTALRLSVLSSERESRGVRCACACGRARVRVGMLLHPTPYTLHPTPYTLHPTPYTLHPTPYTLHPTNVTVL